MVLLLSFASLLSGAHATEAPRVVVLHPATLRRALEADSEILAALKEGQLGQALATSHVLTRSPEHDWLGYPSVLVEVAGRRGWVSAEHVAIERGWDGPGLWVGEPVSRRSLGSLEIFTAGSTGAEWTEALEAFDRPVLEGWLMLSGPQGVQRLPWASSNGWGTTRGPETQVWRDVTGDGVDDLLVVFDETITEAGAAGRTLQIWDLEGSPTAPLLDLPVDDPHWNGLATQHRLGFVDVDIAGKLVDKQTIELLACTGGPWSATWRESAAPESVCAWTRRDQWSWATGAVVPVGSSTGLLQAVLSPGPAFAAPDGAPLEEAAQGAPVCLRRVQGPVGIGDDFWAELTACDGAQASLGWVPSTRLSHPEPMWAEILGPSLVEPSRYIRFDWHRP